MTSPSPKELPVMRGLDPRIHVVPPERSSNVSLSRTRVDGQVEPGHDG